VDCRKKIEEIGEKTSSPAMTQEEIISSTKTVVQGLETLRVEHHQVLNGLQAGSDNTEKTETSTTGLVEEKTSLLKKSIEMIELAMGEAQVITIIFSVQSRARVGVKTPGPVLPPPLRSR